MDNSGPAFPHTYPDLHYQDETIVANGLTKRELAAMLAPITIRDAVEMVRPIGVGWESFLTRDDNRAVVMGILARMHLDYADALLAELAKEKAGE